MISYCFNRRGIDFVHLLPKCLTFASVWVRQVCMNSDLILELFLINYWIVAGVIAKAKS